MNALSVTVVIGSASAIFVPYIHQLEQANNPNPNLPTSVKVEQLIYFLSGYTVTTAQFLQSGFTNSFPLHFNSTNFSFEAKILLSALNNLKVVYTKLKKELDANRLDGLVHPHPFLCFGFSS